MRIRGKGEHGQTVLRTAYGSCRQSLGTCTSQTGKLGKKDLRNRIVVAVGSVADPANLVRRALQNLGYFKIPDTVLWGISESI
jgi:hypothetical protein